MTTIKGGSDKPQSKLRAVPAPTDVAEFGKALLVQLDAGRKAEERVVVLEAILRAHGIPLPE